MNTSKQIIFMETTARLSALWIFVLFNMIFRDLHEFGRPGFLEEVMTGTVNGVQITEGLLLLVVECGNSDFYGSPVSGIEV